MLTSAQTFHQLSIQKTLHVRQQEPTDLIRSVSSPNRGSGTWRRRRAGWRRARPWPRGRLPCGRGAAVRRSDACPRGTGATCAGNHKDRDFSIRTKYWKGHREA